MSIEAACKAWANRVHRGEVRIFPGGPDGGNGDTYRFDVGFGRVMSVELNCYALSEDGATNIDVSVHYKGRVLKQLHLLASGSLQGAVDLGYGVVLTARPWTLRKVHRPRRRVH